MASAMAIGLQQLAPYVRYAQYNEGDERYRVPRRMIYDYEFIYLTRGSALFTLGDEERLLQAGDLHVIPPLVWNACRVPEGGSFAYYACHFDLVYLGRELDFPDDVYVRVDYANLPEVPVQEELLERPVQTFADVELPPFVHTGAPHRFSERFADLLALFERRPFGYEARMRACLLDLIGLLLEETHTAEGVRRDSPHRAMITELVAILRGGDGPQPEAGLEAVASRHGMTPKYARALFKQATGLSWTQYLTRQRMERAKELLRQGGLSVGEIAQRCGYEDLHYFSRLFKKLEGLPPRAYGESLRGPT
ncbi:AraC-like ligand binding domain-containing protein [Paenibacillus sp. UNC496MF]|uniref:helix-turn-helix transcriptional regulator n=1 Tax=Paenibacillus sp. UNC496MF TaxID=1502753 RepID=UPI0008DEB54D|nr:AraC family transcriptional regulator [Paenibacillus sp. UNC496MF]SFJ23151.1 AraC-like ligand binding domain-containing protein [Paenibacillus sp. UNC496MF]